MCRSIFPAWMYIHGMPPGAQLPKEDVGHLELELHEIVNHHKCWELELVL